MRSFAEELEPQAGTDPDPLRAAADLALAARAVGAVRRPVIARRDATPVTLHPADRSIQRALTAAGRERAAESDGEPSFDTQATRGVKLEDFLATMPRKLLGYLPSTGLGMFDVELAPPKLVLTVRIHFLFISGSRADYKNADPRELVWTEQQQRDFMAAWLSTVTEKWSNKFTFYCQRPGWEDLSVAVETNFLPFFAGDRAPVESAVHECKVMKIPKNTDRQSVVDHTVRFPSARFDSNDNQPKENNKDQHTNIHEAGHLLGLGDEYVDGGGPPPKNRVPEHARLALKQLGEKVTYGQTESIMSRGETIMPRHSVTMREALETVAGPEAPHWALTPFPKLTPGLPAPTDIESPDLEPPPAASDPPV